MIQRISLLAAAALCLAGCNPPAPDTQSDAADGPRPIRVATFNVMLNRPAAGALLRDMENPENPQLRAVTEIIQRVRPDILLLNEFDYDTDHRALEIFRTEWLAKSHGGGAPIDYAYSFTAPSNTGEPTGFDLDGDGSTDGPADAYGFGQFPGQYGMAVLSRFPIDTDGIRSFRNFRWKDMPDALLPDNPDTPAAGDWYSDEALQVLRLSSKSHWDVPIRIGDTAIHLLASHPTPPAFDGPEDRNGRRNHDEIRLWADYIAPGRGDYLVDDRGRKGGLSEGARFVIAGDQNADPYDAGSLNRAIRLLIEHPLVNSSIAPTSVGGAEQAALQGGVNASHSNPPGEDSSDFQDDGDNAVGNLRLDYVLPSKAGFAIIDAGVFWPATDDPFFALVGTFPVVSSDHRLVWIDLKLTD